MDVEPKDSGTSVICSGRSQPWKLSIAFLTMTEADPVKHETMNGVSMRSSLSNMASRPVESSFRDPKDSPSFSRQAAFVHQRFPPSEANTSDETNFGGAGLATRHNSIASHSNAFVQDKDSATNTRCVISYDKTWDTEVAFVTSTSKCFGSYVPLNDRLTFKHPNVVDLSTARTDEANVHPQHHRHYDALGQQRTRSRAPRPPYSKEQKFFIMYCRIVRNAQWHDIEDWFTTFFGLRTKSGLTSVYYRIRRAWNMKEITSTGSSTLESDRDKVIAKANQCSESFLISLGTFKNHMNNG